MKERACTLGVRVNMLNTNKLRVSLLYLRKPETDGEVTLNVDEGRTEKGNAAKTQNLSIFFSFVCFCLCFGLVWFVVLFPVIHLF